MDGIKRRLEAIAPEDLRRLVLLVAEVHEERGPDRLRAAAKRADAGRDTDAVVAIALGFGDVWKVADDVSLDEYLGVTPAISVRSCSSSWRTKAVPPRR